MRTAWVRGAAAAGSLLALLGLGSCALVFNYSDYKDAPPDGATDWSIRSKDADDQMLGGLALDADGNVLITGSYKGSITLGDRMLGPSTLSYTAAIFAAEIGPSSTTRSIMEVCGMDVPCPGLGTGVAKDAQNHTLVAGDGTADDPMSDLHFGLVRQLDGPMPSSPKDVSGPRSSALGVSTDAIGNVYVLAYFQEVVVACGPRMNNGDKDILLVKYDKNGKCSWDLPIGAAQDDVAWGIAAGSDKSVFITGEYRGETAKMPPPPLSGPNDSAIFVMKVNDVGSILWSKGFRSKIPNQDMENARGAAIAIDPEGNPWVTGTLIGLVSDPDNMITLTSNNGSSDVFLMHLSGKDGSVLFWERYGDAERQVGTGIAVAEDGSVFVTGVFSGTILFDKELSSDGPQAMFLAKFDKKGKPLRSAVYGANEHLGPRDVRVAAGKGAVVIAGSWSGPLDFNQGELAPAGGLDVFVAKFPQ